MERAKAVYHMKENRVMEKVAAQIPVVTEKSLRKMVLVKLAMITQGYLMIRKFVNLRNAIIGKN